MMSSIKKESNVWHVFLCSKLFSIIFLTSFSTLWMSIFVALSLTKALKILLIPDLLLIFQMLQFASIILFWEIPVPLFIFSRIWLNTFLYYLIVEQLTFCVYQRRFMYFVLFFRLKNTSTYFQRVLKFQLVKPKQ